MEKRIVWQPTELYQPSFGFSIRLDFVFAHEMLTTRIPLDIQKRFVELERETAQSFGFNYREPIDFHDDTCMATGFYIGQNGKWLTLDVNQIEALVTRANPDRPLIYSSHNIDTSREAYALMALFDRWIAYSDNLREHAINS